MNRIKASKEMIKAAELIAQFGSNAKYVVLEIKEEIKTFINTSKKMQADRLIFWSDVITCIDKIRQIKEYLNK